MGITPYRGSRTSAGQDYFRTTRYKGFENYLKRAAEKRGIRVTYSERTEGVWGGVPEPAASIWLTGDLEHIIDLADELGARYNQSAVLLFAPDDESEGFIYRIKLLAGQERDVVMDVLVEHGFAGARLLASDTIEIADPDGRLVNQVLAVTQALGATLTYSRGHVILREKNVHYGKGE
jgi:hypothetical protein